VHPQSRRVKIDESAIAVNSTDPGKVINVESTSTSAETIKPKIKYLQFDEKVKQVGNGHEPWKNGIMKSVLSNPEVLESSGLMPHGWQYKKMVTNEKPSHLSFESAEYGENGSPEQWNDLEDSSSYEEYETHYEDDHPSQRIASDNTFSGISLDDMIDLATNLYTKGIKSSDLLGFVQVKFSKQLLIQLGRAHYWSIFSKIIP